MDMNVVLNAIKAEMKPSMGCTEPVAIALAVSRTCEYLTNPAEKLDMVISSNIFKFELLIPHKFLAINGSINSKLYFTNFTFL